MATKQLIDLAEPRVIAIRHGSRLFAYTVAPIPSELWLKYFDGIVSTAERVGQEIVQHIDASSAGLELVEALIDRERGIEAVNGETTIPFGHRLAIANVLTSAYVPDEDMRGFGEVPLVAIWSAGESGAMHRHKNLVHVLNEPSFEQNRRYRRDDSRSQVIGGSRKGTTVYKGAQRTLAAIYDELILRVEGYVVNGQPLEGREAIARSMDAYHKVAAVARLFAPQEVAAEEEDA